MKPTPKVTDKSASQNITERIRELGDWRGERLAEIRALIHEADPDVVEEWKWMGTPVWSHDGIVCTGASYKLVVKLTFAKGASLEDPKKLLQGKGQYVRHVKVRKAADIHPASFGALVRQAMR